MSRWFRFYDDAMNDPKLLRLSDEVYRAWTILLCVASKNGGTLPPTEDIALALRLKPVKVAEWITKLVKGGLLDNIDGVFAPHNWNGRQYKTDVTDPTAAERMRRYRENRRNERNATVTDKRPEAEQNRTEAEQTRAAAENFGGKVDPSDIALRVLKTDLMEAFGAKRCPDLSRASDWLAKGYARDMILTVVREGLAKKPDIASLAYFDAALAERHTSRAPTPSERAAGVPAETLDWAIRHFARSGLWPGKVGPEPGQPGCRASVELLAAHGLGPDGRKLTVDA